MAYKKYVTLSFDDGLEQDKRTIEILKQYGLKATFNLNSGLLGQKERIGRIGDYGLFNLPDRDSLAAKILKASPAYRIPEDEIEQVYEGFEIAAHGYHHDNLKKLHGDELDATVGRDLDNLRRITGQEIKGYVYAYGGYSAEAETYLREHGILYARAIDPKNTFEFPENPLQAGSAWLIGKDILQLITKFSQAEATDHDLLLSLWGHGYEFDFGTENCNWTRFEKICEQLARLNDVFFCTNLDAFTRSV